MARAEPIRIREPRDYPVDVQDDAVARICAAMARCALVPERDINRLDITCRNAYGSGAPSIAMLRVLGGLAGGLHLTQIAELTGESIDTLKDRVKYAQAALGARSTTHAVAKALRLRLI